MLTKGVAAVTSSLGTSASSSAEPRQEQASATDAAEFMRTEERSPVTPIPRLVDGICGREGEGNAATLSGLDGP